jgi:hypothetical protein
LAFFLKKQRTTSRVEVLLDGTIKRGQDLDMNFLKLDFSLKAKGNSSSIMISENASLRASTSNIKVPGASP